MTMTIPAGTLVVVANGGAARVFRNVGDDKELTLKQEALLEGMNIDDDGPGGAMPAESSASQIDEATFAKQLAKGSTRMRNTAMIPGAALRPAVRSRHAAVLHKKRSPVAGLTRKDFTTRRSRKSSALCRSPAVARPSHHDAEVEPRAPR